MEKIVVFGAPSGGVFGLRQLRKQWPKSIIYVIAPKSDIGYYSNCYNEFIVVNNSRELINAS